MKEETSQPVETSTPQRSKSRPADSTDCPHPAGSGGAGKVLDHYPQLRREVLAKGTETLLREELARKDGNGHTATDPRRAQVLAAFWQEATILWLEWLDSGQELRRFKEDSGLGLNRPGLEADGKAEISDDGGIKMPETYRLLMFEATTKGAETLLREELALKDSTGLGTYNPGRAWALAILWVNTSTACFEWLIDWLRAAIRDLEQPSLF